MSDVRRMSLPARGVGVVWRLAAAAALLVALMAGLAARPGDAGAAACVVTSDADSGAGTLREKVGDATCDSITFTLPNPSTITLTTGQLTINRNLTITGPGAAALAVSGNDASRVFNVTGGTVTIRDLTVTNGRADLGGGIFNINSTLTVSGGVVRGSTATDAGGGLAVENGSLVVTGSAIIDNDASQYGGGIYVIAGNGTTTVALENCTVADNSAAVGGGLSTGANPGGTATVSITNCTVSGSTAGYGIEVGNAGGPLAVQTKNTIVAANAPGNFTIYGGGVLTSQGYNVSSDNSGASQLTATGDVNNTNPRLAPLGSYGGPTQTFALLPGSPAIDRVPASGAGCPATDQRGVARPQQSACDSGAFESRGFAMTLVNGNNQSAVINTAFANPLRVEVTSAFGEPVQGGRVTFTGPGSGAGIQGSPLGDGVNASGRAGVTPTANGTVGGPYTVAVSAAGVATGVNFSLTNLAIPTTLVAADAGGTYTGTVNLSATLTATSGGAALSGKTIAFTLDGVAVCGGGGQPACPTTDASGVAALTGVGLGSIGAGSYPSGVGASFAGDSTTVAASDTAQLTVAQAATGLTLVRGTATYGDADGTLVATLRRTNGTPGPLAGATVSFTLQGTPVGGATTNAQGVATLTGVTLPPGLQAGNVPAAVCATFGGNANHLGTGPTCGPLAIGRKILVVKPLDREVVLRQPNPATTPPATCLDEATPTAACWLMLADGYSFASGDDWSDLGLFPARGAGLRFLYSRNYPQSNPSEYVGKTYRISAAGLSSANYDIRYQSGTLTVVAAPTP